MKKVTMLFVMSLLMLCFLGACGSQTSQPAENTVSQITQTGQQNEASAENATVMPELEGNNRKTLVVYFSASGNTRAVAEYIAEAANADTLELVPVAAYTDADLDWTVENSRVNREYEDESLRNIELVEETVQDWKAYDTVFVGYPIWWGIAAWPVNGFVEANDFTGKTVIPFCTSTSSELGESAHLLAELAGTGDWLDGQRFSSGASQEDVQSWVEGLGL